MNKEISYFKKVLVMLMAVMMVFTMMPSMAWATNDSTDNAAETITVYITVSDQGNVELGKNNTAMAWMPVEVPANKGTASLNATLQALHETYYIVPKKHQLEKHLKILKSKYQLKHFGERTKLLAFLKTEKFWKRTLAKLM